MLFDQATIKMCSRCPESPYKFFFLFFHEEHRAKIYLCGISEKFPESWLREYSRSVGEDLSEIGHAITTISLGRQHPSPANVINYGPLTWIPHGWFTIRVLDLLDDAVSIIYGKLVGHLENTNKHDIIEVEQIDRWPGFEYSFYGENTDEQL